MNTVLVTGAAGALGQRLLTVLRQRGWRVRALVHRRPVPGADETVVGDLLDPSTLVPATAEIDAVMHLAAVTHARSAAAYARINALGTRALVEAACAAGTPRFVQASTRAIGANGGSYSASKLAAEHEVATSRLDTVIVRLPEIVGAGAAEGVDRIVSLAREGRTIPIVGDGGDEICPIHVDDAIAALVAALSAPAGRSYTLAGECMTVLAFAQACIDASGHGRIVRVPIPVIVALSVAARVLPLPLYPDQLARLRVAKAAASPEAAHELGFRPRSVAETIRGLQLSME